MILNILDLKEIDTDPLFQDYCWVKQVERGTVNEQD